MHTQSPVKKPITPKRAIGTVLPLCLTALLLAGAVISVANDVYAFVKADMPVTLTADGVLDADALSRLLQKEGVIRNAFAFKLYLRSHGLGNADVSLDEGLVLNGNMSYRELVNEIF